MTSDNRDPAMQRLLILNLVRLAGLGPALMGVAVLAGRLPLVDAQADPIIGTVLLAVGALDMLLVPALLARRWRSGG